MQAQNEKFQKKRFIKVKSGYNRNAERNQEIGDEFLNPDQDMEEAATKIQRFYRDKNQKKKEKQATTKKETKKEATKEKLPKKKEAAPEKETTEKKAEGYDRENEKN